MPSQNERERSRARLQRDAPISKDVSLAQLQQQAADYVEESKRRHATEPHELIASMFDALARNYFHHLVRKKLAATRFVKPPR